MKPTQVCRITQERISVNRLSEISDKTIPGLVLPEIVYNVKNKLDCIFVDNHNPEFVLLKRQTIGLVTSCVVTQKEQGQARWSVVMQRRASRGRVMTWIPV